MTRVLVALLCSAVVGCSFSISGTPRYNPRTEQYSCKIEGHPMLTDSVGMLLGLAATVGGIVAGNKTDGETPEYYLVSVSGLVTALVFAASLGSGLRDKRKCKKRLREVEDLKARGLASGR